MRNILLCLHKSFPAFLILWFMSVSKHCFIHFCYGSQPSGNVLATYWKQQWQQQYRLSVHWGGLLAVFLPPKSLLRCVQEDGGRAFLPALALSKQRGPCVPQPLSVLSGRVVQISSTHSINQQHGRSAEHTCPLSHPSGESLKIQAAAINHR